MVSIETIAVIAVTSSLLAFLFLPSLQRSNIWRATLTPLASIIGSGFLIIAPLLCVLFGKWAIAAMAAILVLSYLLGTVVRYNIRHVEPLLSNGSTPWSLSFLEILTRPVLSIAYIISITFYLQLLSAYILQGLGFHNQTAENVLTTIILLVIGFAGKLRGLAMLENFEQYSVSIKLSIIGGFLAGLVVLNINMLIDDSWALPHPLPEVNIEHIRKLLGMLIVVQGFETSRYLGLRYSQDIRISTMRHAQIISVSIYLLFIGTVMVIFQGLGRGPINETAMIGISGQVTPVLPVLLVIAAVMSQFSAAVADTVGSSGLAVEATKGRITLSNSFLLIITAAIWLTWLTDIFEIITLASRAFALYYLLQSLEAAVATWRNPNDYYRIPNLILFIFITLIMAIVFLFGIPAE